MFVLLSCASKKNNEIYVEIIPDQLLSNENRFDLDNKVYPVNREVLYRCTIEKDQKILEIELRYIKMTIQGTTKPFSNFHPDYSQTVIQFKYLDKDFKVITSERTGLIENDKNIWMHPPRSDDVGILQLSAFPYIKLDATKRWQWKLDAAFQNYQDVHLTHNYKKGKSINYQNDLGNIVCTPIYATSKSYLGTTTSNFLFNETYGFIQLKFMTIENTTITLDLILNED